MNLVDKEKAIKEISQKASQIIMNRKAEIQKIKDNSKDLEEINNGILMLELFPSKEKSSELEKVK